VVKAVNGIINMAGPNGEGIDLGIAEYVRNGPFQPGQRPNGPIAMTMPYQATLAQKFVMFQQQALAAAGHSTDRISMISATPVPLGNIAQCGIFLWSDTNAQSVSDIEMRFCALPMDTNGIYKLVWLVAVIPAPLAAQERATAEAVLSSYKPSPATLKLLLQPASPSAPPVGVVMPGVDPAMRSGEYEEQSSDRTQTCFDEGVIEQLPEWQLPPYCR
jgi:hypothetical protein